MATTTTPTVSEAIGYVRAHFDGYDAPQAFRICGTVAPAIVSGEPVAGARDVLFTVDSDPRPCRFTVWFEEGIDDSPMLYGEW